ncbi:hypothetical protein EJ06DRAFT_254624 [Trichodelitschia bisporula]|uniref:Uncharacterized protein n=1 Tax=Trichodelitschia bisporula TaxID=703511 RepID=A0A6G1HJL0_9PEZI|nr:hypothetical protein EJ06DRAFT_254624 [Trichodelitschia bisporula]
MANMRTRGMRSEARHVRQRLVVRFLSIVSFLSIVRFMSIVSFLSIVTAAQMLIRMYRTREASIQIPLPAHENSLPPISPLSPPNRAVTSHPPHAPPAILYARLAPIR